MKKYRNVAFLSELMINILVFSISCAILAGLFGKASMLSKKTKEETFASAKVYALVETWRVRGVDGLDGAVAQPDGTILCQFDKNWEPAQGENAVFTVEMQIVPEVTTAGTLNHVKASAKNSNGQELYSLTTAEYRSGEGAAGL